MSKKNYTMYLEESTIELVKKEAEKQDRTMSWVFNDAIKKQLNKA